MNKEGMKSVRGSMLKCCIACLVVVVMAGPAFCAEAGQAKPGMRIREEVEKLIAEAGKTPPPWWDQTPLKFPKTLDLTWKTTKPWNNQKNINQYLWDVIYPNPGRWGEGVRVAHHAMTVNKGNAEVADLAAEAMARLYGEMMEDHARAAFWARRTEYAGVLLANSYFKLGSKEMAAEALTKMQEKVSPDGQMIKLWAELGELEYALGLAEEMAEFGQPQVAYLVAGDACKAAGRWDDALGYYRKVLAAPKLNKQGTHQKRAQASIDAIRVVEALDLKRVADGSYKASSVAYTGQLEVMVIVKAGRIEKVEVTRHTEKQFYSSISDTTRQIVEKQGVKGVDATSGATITSEAIINGTAKALGGAMK